ncbi:hypothetical protein HU200_016789 [Digitaria exilis]|uniref:Uncharacterized protein n=1 Tax=Digitaria exilis TaxID=1010633 RepID=A0A835KIG4_9POAL|nr:hypothetical protein HU200_016789 [Digitaria exilis]
MALLVAVASAGRADLPMSNNRNRCTRSYCGKHSTGSCKFAGQFVYCCCGPVHPTASTNVHPLGH